MGLGPSVCQYCQVIAEYNPGDMHNAWYCPICGNTKCYDNAGFDPERWKVLEENRKVLEFFKGNKYISPHDD